MKESAEPGGKTVSEQEATLLALYNRLSPQKRVQAEEAIAALAAESAKEPAVLFAKTTK